MSINEEAHGYVPPKEKPKRNLYRYFSQLKHRQGNTGLIVRNIYMEFSYYFFVKSRYESYQQCFTSQHHLRRLGL